VVFAALNIIEILMGKGNRKCYIYKPSILPIQISSCLKDAFVMKNQYLNESLELFKNE